MPQPRVPTAPTVCRLRQRLWGSLCILSVPFSACYLFFTMCFFLSRCDVTLCLCFPVCVRLCLCFCGSLSEPLSLASPSPAPTLERKKSPFSLPLPPSLSPSLSQHLFSSPSQYVEQSRREGRVPRYLFAFPGCSLHSSPPSVAPAGVPACAPVCGGGRGWGEGGVSPDGLRRHSHWWSGPHGSSGAHRSWGRT